MRATHIFLLHPIVPSLARSKICLQEFACEYNQTPLLFADADDLQLWALDAAGDHRCWPRWFSSSFPLSPSIPSSRLLTRLDFPSQMSRGCPASSRSAPATHPFRNYVCRCAHIYGRHDAEASKRRCTVHTTWNGVPKFVPPMRLLSHPAITLTLQQPDNSMHYIYRCLFNFIL